MLVTLYQTIQLLHWDLIETGTLIVLKFGRKSLKNFVLSLNVQEAVVVNSTVVR